VSSAQLLEAGLTDAALPEFVDFDDNVFEDPNYREPADQ
jgi:hypothetical protein